MQQHPGIIIHYPRDHDNKNVRHAFAADFWSKRYIRQIILMSYWLAATAGTPFSNIREIVQRN